NNYEDFSERISPPIHDIEAGSRKDNPLGYYREEEKINYMLDLEKQAKNYDEKVKAISQCSYSEKTERIYIENTKGLKLEDIQTIGTISLGAVTEEGDKMQTGYSHYVFNDLKDEYKDRLIKD